MPNNDTADTAGKIEKINLSDALSSFSDTWQPRNIATLNDYDVRLAKIEGEFVWHSHDDTDELFLLVDGEATIELRDGAIKLTPGELVVVPKGVEHRPVSPNGASLLLVEPTGTTNTGTTNAELPDYINTTAGVDL